MLARRDSLYLSLSSCLSWLTMAGVDPVGSSWLLSYLIYNCDYILSPIFNSFTPDGASKLGMMSPLLWEPLCRSLCISTSAVDWLIGVWEVTGVVTWSSGGGVVVYGAMCSFELILFCPIYFSFFVEHATFGVFCFSSSHLFIVMEMSLDWITTSGVWEAVGITAKGVISGYFDSSITSSILVESYLLTIFAIFTDILLFSEAESLFVDRTRGCGQATGVVACLTIGVIVTYSDTSMVGLSSPSLLSLDNTNN